MYVTKVNMYLLILYIALKLSTQLMKKSYISAPICEKSEKNMFPYIFTKLIHTSFHLQERLSHGISASGFPGNAHRTSEFQPPYFPPTFPTQQPTPQEVFAAQNAHLADPYHVTNSLHSFQQSQVSYKRFKSRYRTRTTISRSYL